MPKHLHRDLELLKKLTLGVGSMVESATDRAILALVDHRSDLADEVKNLNIRSIAIPPLGSGLGGLDWAKVRPLIEQAVAPLQGVDVLIFEPGGGPSDACP